MDMEDFRESIKETLDFYLKEEKRLVSLLATLPRGSIRKKKINGNEYYYLKYRKGKEIIEEYLGKTIPEGLIEGLRKRKQIEKELKKIRETIEFLKYKKEKSIALIKPLEDFFKMMTSKNLWDEGIEIIGAWCFAIYQKYLPIRQYPLKTQDIDILIPYPYKGKMFDIANYLKQLGFIEHINPDYSTYFTGYGFKIEFLAPEKGKGHARSPFVKNLGVSPQMLRYMSVLFQESIVFSIARGIKIRVPAPSAFMLHKLLVASKRKTEGKMEKDLRQAVYTGEYVIKIEKERERLLKLLSEIPGKWRKTIQKNLEIAKDLLPQEETIIKALIDIIKPLPHKI